MRTFAFCALCGVIGLLGAFLVRDESVAPSDARKAAPTGIRIETGSPIVNQPTMPVQSQPQAADASESFEVTAPAKNRAIQSTADQPTITVNNEGKIFLNTVPVSLEELKQKLSSARTATRDVPVVIRGDSQTQYPDMRDVMDAIAQAGNSQVEPADSATIVVDDLQIDIPAGQFFPVAVSVSARADSSEDYFYSDQQRELAERVTAEFAKEVANQSTATGDDRALRADLPALQDATAKADERFRALFGHDTYNREVIRQHRETYQ